MDKPAVKTKAQLLKEAKRVAEDLKSLYKDIQDAGGESPDQEIVAALAVPMCRLAKMIIPNVHQKIDEIVYGDAHGLDVQDKQHGADLKDADGKRIELKVSICTARQPKCNFNWPIAAGKTEAERKMKVLKSIREKTGDGGEAVLIVKDGLDRELAKFRLSGEFLYQYFARVKLGKSSNYNMGCKRCSKCKGFHRMMRLQKANDLFGQDPSKVDWAELDTVCPSDC